MAVVIVKAWAHKVEEQNLFAALTFDRNYHFCDDKCLSQSF